MSPYQAKKANQDGVIEYIPVENHTWQSLMERQLNIVNNRACDEFLKGLEILSLPTDRVPQCIDVTRQLQKSTGWSVQPVPAMISLQAFFDLIANKKFPAATFIRTPEEFDYLKEPDIFHEFFGHCPLLTHQAYADFVQWYGQMAQKAPAKVQSLLGRLFWFTIEFGLVQSKQGLRIYGGGILSSSEETVYALESSKPNRNKFNIMKALTTPYRYDQIQKQYFILDRLDELYEIQQQNVIHLAENVITKTDQDDFNIC